MNIPKNSEILALLDQLETKNADDLETLWLEFKPWPGTKTAMKEAVEYAVCFANSEGGVIVFGVADKIKGRKTAIHGAHDYNLDTWRRGIFDSTRQNLTVTVEELAVPEGTGKLLIVRVPKGEHTPYGTAQGLFKKRVGKNCMPLDAQGFHRTRSSTGAVDWSGQPAKGVEVGDLDPTEIARTRNILQRVNPESDLLKVDEQTFLIGLGAIRNEKVTNTGLLLFGREQALSQHCPQHQVHYVLQVSEMEVARNDSYRRGLLQIIEQIESSFGGPANPEQELTVGFFKVRIPAFPIEVVREAVLNAITHRDYTDPGEVLIRHTSKELVITSPGGFLAGITPENILRHESVSRNRTLAEAFQKLRLVERAGIGRRRIFVPMLSYGKRMPIYETDGTRVTLRIFDGGFDQRMASLIAKWKEEGRNIDLDALILLTYLKENVFIDTLSASKLLQLSKESVRGIMDELAQPRVGILERRGRTKAATYHLTKGVARDLLGKAAYTKIKGLNPIRYAEMVKAFVADHGSITPQECRELLGLGDSQTARVDVSRYLKKWSGPDGFLKRSGKPPKVVYTPKVD